MKDVYRNWDDKKAYEMLEMFGLEDDKKISKLSKGNKARVKIILGFAQNAKYTLLDEPFSGIDIFKREDFIGIMAKYMSDDQSIIITTHEINEIQMIVDDVILINEGMSIIDKMRGVYRGE